MKAATDWQEQADRSEEDQAKIDAEFGFQRSKQMKNQMEAYLDRVLLEGEVPPGLRDQVVHFVSGQTQNSQKRKADEARMLQLMSPLPPQVDFAFHKFFLEKTEWRNLQAFPQTLTLVADPWRADVCVVEDPGNPPRNVLWNIALKGGHVVTLDFALKRGKGLCFSYGIAIATKRSIFVDPQVEENDPVLAEAVRRTARMPQSKWKLLSTWEEFAWATDKVAGVHLPVKQRREMEVLALTTEPLAHHMSRRNVLSKVDFLKSTARVSCTQRGICGK